MRPRRAWSNGQSLVRLTFSDLWQIAARQHAAYVLLAYENAPSIAADRSGRLSKSGRAVSIEQIALSLRWRVRCPGWANPAPAATVKMAWLQAVLSINKLLIVTLPLPWFDRI